MKNMTIRELSDLTEKTERTIQRWVDAYNKANDKNFDYGLNASLSDPDLLFYIEKRAKIGLSDKKGLISNKFQSAIESPKTIPDIVLMSKEPDIKEGPGLIAEFPEPEKEPDIKKIVDQAIKEQAIEMEKDFEKRALDKLLSVPDNKKTLSDSILHGDVIAVICLLILVFADVFSCGWIAWKIFEGFVPGAVFFSIIGIAIAYASIKNAVSFSGYEADAWLWGFGLFQFLLHASAFDLFDPRSYDNWSLAVGKLVICLCLPLATTGIAITFKKRKS